MQTLEDYQRQALLQGEEKTVEAASREALQAFEDAYGQVLYLGERECSLQCRYQKILEEAPAPGLSQSLRAQMGAAAVRLAQTALSGGGAE